jgi:hypothetical protein
MLAPALVYAAPRDVIILDESALAAKPSNPYLDFLQKNFFINGGGFWSGSGNEADLNQAFAFVRAGLDYSFSVLGLEQQIYVAGGYSYRRLEVGLEFREGALERVIEPTGDIVQAASRAAPCTLEGSYQQGFFRTCEFLVKTEQSQFELREAYGSFEVWDDVVLNIGRQRPTWGQFEVFSIVNNILPVESQTKEFGLSNANLRMPQDLAQLKIFLFERIELSGYVFYGTTLDPLLDDALTGGRDIFFLAQTLQTLQTLLVVILMINVSLFSFVMRWVMAPHSSTKINLAMQGVFFGVEII